MRVYTIKAKVTVPDELTEAAAKLTAIAAAKGALESAGAEMTFLESKPKRKVTISLAERQRRSETARAMRERRQAIRSLRAM